MKIVITGGAGFIASHIADAYIKLGHEVVIIDNLSTGKKEYINKKAVFYQTDITDRGEIEKIINKEKPEVINHHAAQINVRNSVDNPFFDAQVNIIGLLNLIEPARMHRLKKIIFASSGGVVYGEADTIPTKEKYVPLLPLSPYGITKLASELYLNFYHQTYRIPFIALRYANVYGPRQNPHGEAGVVAIFINKFLNNESPVINGDGKQTRDYVYIDDVVKANILALTSLQSGSFNIGTGKETNVIQIYQKIKKIIKSRIIAKHGPAKAGEQKRSCLDCSLAKKKLGWRPEISLNIGLIRTIEYFRKNGIK